MKKKLLCLLMAFTAISAIAAPTPVISSSSSSPTSLTTIPVTVEFSEAVTGFTVGDIILSNASVFGFTGSGTSYSFNMTFSGPGTATININSNVAQNAHSQFNDAAAQFSIVFDNAGPIAEISSSVANPTNQNLIPLTLQFNEVVTGFIVSDIYITGGTLTNFAGSGAAYTVDLIPDGDGTVTIFVLDGVAQDIAGNENTFSSFFIEYDSEAPSVTISSPEASPTSASPIVINVVFSEVVLNFDTNDIQVTGGTMTNFSGAGQNYSFELVPAANGQLTVQVDAFVANDEAGNANTAATPFTIEYIAACSEITMWNGNIWTQGQPSANQAAVIAADYASTGDLTACSLTIKNNAQVIVQSGHDFNIAGTVSVESGSTFTLQSNANLLQTGTINANTGTMTVQREASMRRLDYVYWSSPVSGQNLLSFSAQTLPNRFYELYEPGNVFVPLTTAEFVPAKGYIIRAPNTFPANGAMANFIGTFTGTIHNGDLMIPVIRTNPERGYNLIGNPYPSPISADAFLDENPGTLYFWTHTNQTQGGGANYATYNETGAASAAGGEVPNGIVQVGQGFLLRTPSTGDVTFTNSMRVGDNAGQFFRTNTEKHRIWLNLSGHSGILNQMLLGYTSSATNGYDIAADGALHHEGSSIASNIAGSKFAIQGRALPFQQTDVVNLYFTAVSEGSYSISIDHTDGLFAEGQDIYLNDTTNGTAHNLQDGAYTFASTAGGFADRFQLQFTNSTLGIDNPEVTNGSVVIFGKDGMLNIDSGSKTMQSVKVFDIRGRLIYEQSVVNSTQTSFALQSAQQVLLVQVTINGSVISKKVVF